LLSEEAWQDWDRMIRECDSADETALQPKHSRSFLDPEVALAFPAAAAMLSARNGRASQIRSRQ
jgi:hypothetical protein